MVTNKLKEVVVMHPIDTLYTNIFSHHTVPMGDTQKPPKCKSKVIYDETLAKFIGVGRYLQTLTDKASQYAAVFCFLKAYAIVHSYSEQTVYIKNYDFYFDANFYECMHAGQLIMCNDFNNHNLFDAKKPINLTYADGRYDYEVTQMLDFLYNEKAQDSVNILAELYVLWEFQFIINIRELTSKYTVSDYTKVAQDLLLLTATPLELRDCCNRLKFMIDNYVIQNNLPYQETSVYSKEELPKLIKRYKTCRALRIVLCYDNYNNITGIYYYIDQFGNTFFNRIPIVFIHPMDAFGTYTAKISEQYQLTFRVFDNSIHFYQHTMCSCYNNCQDCVGMRVFIELKVIASSIDVYVHNLAQELCTSLIDHQVTKICNVVPNKSTILMCDNSNNYATIPEEEVNKMELWHKFNQ